MMTLILCAHCASFFHSVPRTCFLFFLDDQDYLNIVFCFFVSSLFNFFIAKFRVTCAACDNLLRGGSCASSTFADGTDASIVFDVWQHVAVTVDTTAEVSRQVKIYIDGVDKTSAPAENASPRDLHFADVALLGGGKTTSTTTTTIDFSERRRQLLIIGASGSSSCGAEVSLSCAVCGCFTGGGGALPTYFPPI